MQRQKRPVNKPLRYQTTSSDEDPKRQRTTAPATIVSGILQDDIDDIEQTLQEETTSSNINIRQTHTDTPNIQSYTNTHTTTSSFPDSSLYSHTHTNTEHIPHKQTHTNTYIPRVALQERQKQHNAQNFTLTTDYDKVYYTNNLVSQSYVPGTRTLPMQQDVHQMYQQCGQPGGLPLHHTIEADMKKMNDKLHTVDTEMKKMKDQINTVEVEMKKMNSTLNKILKCVQERNTAPQKPAFLLITTVEQMMDFENVNDENYSNAVNYFQYVGGFSLKEAVHLCLKEGLSDPLAQSFTWFGREEGRRPLYNTRLIKAIYDAICRNRHFEKPPRSDFQRQMQESLRVAKQRHRSKMRGARTRDAGARVNRDLWNDENDDDEYEDDDNIVATNDE